VSWQILYVLYVYFQLFTHASLFEDKGKGEDEAEEEPEEVLLPLSGAMPGWP